MSLSAEHQEELREVIRLIESLRAGLSGAGDFDSVRLDSHLVTALTSAKAALAIATSPE